MPPERFSESDELHEDSNSFWWVNQNKTFKQEHDGGYIWAPQKTKSGGEAFHHVNVAKVKQGDVIWHYCNQRLCAVSEAINDAFKEPKPPELDTDDWETDGYMVKVKYRDLLQPIDRDAIPLEVRMELSREPKSPFNRGGTVNQGYLFALTKRFVREVSALFPQLQPDASQRIILKEDLRKDDDVSAFDELRNRIRNLNVNREFGTIKLYKPAILLAVLENFDQLNPENEVHFDFILKNFRDVMRRYGIKAGTTQAEEAFFRLDKDGIWSFTAKEGEQLKGLEPSKLRKAVSYAQFPERYFEVLKNSELRKSLEKDLKNTWFGTIDAAVTKIMPDTFSRAQALKALSDDIAADGYYFEPWQIASYVTALRTKPFVILAGVSGSGKSQLPQLVSDITGGIAKLIPVRPDWTDSSDVLGYVQLNDKFVPGKLMRVAADASNEPNVSFCAVIDEMNIARVEHYFAEVLSVLEQTRSDDATVFPLFDHKFEKEDDQNWSLVGLSKNLSIVGTVNMDESTHGFSKKVLDRAFTIEFSEIDLRQWKEVDASDEYRSKAWPVGAWLPRANRLSKLHDLTEVETAKVESIISTLSELNEILGQAQLQLAYRSRDEIVLFVLHANEVSESFVEFNGTSVDPLDLAIQMKVLPRIAGGSVTIQTLICELLSFAKEGGAQKMTEEQAKEFVMTSWVSKRQPSTLNGTRFPRTCARLCLMWHRLNKEGYTSYWL